MSLQNTWLGKELLQLRFYDRRFVEPFEEKLPPFRRKHVLTSHGQLGRCLIACDM